MGVFNARARDVAGAFHAVSFTPVRYAPRQPYERTTKHHQHQLLVLKAIITTP